MVRMPFNFSFRRNKKKEKDDNDRKCNIDGKEIKKIVFPSERRKLNHMTPADFRGKLDDDMEKSVENCRMSQFPNEEKIFIHGVLILPEMNNEGTLMYAAKLKKFYNHNTTINNEEIDKALQKLEKTKELFEEKSKSLDNKVNYLHQSNTTSSKRIPRNIFNSFPSQKHR